MFRVSAGVSTLTGSTWETTATAAKIDLVLNQNWGGIHLLAVDTKFGHQSMPLG